MRSCRFATLIIYKVEKIGNLGGAGKMQFLGLFYCSIKQGKGCWRLGLDRIVKSAILKIQMLGTVYYGFTRCQTNGISFQEVLFVL